MSKTIVVTGVSRGIGHQVALQAAAKGYRVFALSRNIESFSSLKQIIPLKVDLSKEEEVEEITKQIIAQVNSIDILINNAGYLINKPFMETSREAFISVFQVNVFGLSSLTRMLLPKISKKGHVVNISSMGGITGTSKFPGLAAYSSSKAAVSILTELLAEEFKLTGPAFNALALGAVQTEMLAQAFPDFQAPITAENMADYILNFAEKGHHFYNGKVLPVSLSTP